MDQTSSTAAVVVPIAATLGVIGMVTTLHLAMRRARNAICPQRARREAEAALRLTTTAPTGGAPVIGAQRGAVRTPVA